MKHSTKRLLAVVLAIMMVVTSAPLTALASYDASYQSTTHTVFKHTEQTLAPGVSQYTNYAYTTADNKQMVYYVTEADVNRDDVMLQVAYKDMQYENYGMDKLTNIVACANDKYSDPTNPEYISDYYSVVSATNGNGYNMTTGQPSGVWAMGGTVIQEYTGSTAFFAILKDGRAVMGKTVAEWNAYKADPGIQEAINAFGSILVWDGAVSVSATGSYYTDRASRTMMGVTEDGKVLLIVVDGRQEPFSCGASMAELAQIMMEAGAKYAINLDGGGSTTYMAKNEGTNDCVITNRPSDGSERAISNGLIIASLAAPSDVFDHASISVENDYVMPGASVAISATGVSPAGTAADIPEGVTYTAKYGTVENGVYTAGNTAGVDTISMIYNGDVIGTCDVNVVIPDSISFATASIACPYGKTAKLDVVPMYGLYEVAYSASNVNFTIGNASFGTIDAENMTFSATSNTLSTTTSTITVATTCTPSVSATAELQVGKGSEVIWDFEDQSTENMSLFDYYNSGVQSSLEIVDSTTGKVHNGDYALAINYDFTQLTYYEDYLDVMFCYNADQIKAHGNNTDATGASIGGLPEDYIDITGATGIGMWIYVPDEIDAKGLNPRFFFGHKKTNSTAKWTRGTSGMKLLVDVQHIPTDNWYYYYADLSAYSSYAGLTLQSSRPLNENGTTKNGMKGYPTDYYAGPCFEFYVEDSAWKSYQNKSYNSKFTLYIDNYTVDYSSVVDDREAPEFSSAVYACTGMWEAESFTDGKVINGNDIDFTINVADATRKLAGGVTTYTATNNATGIDADSAKVYIDGVQVDATYKNGKLALDKAVVLADGAHKVMFEIADNMGNVAKKTMSFTVNAGTNYDTISIVPHDTTLTETPVGSLYYIDLVATDISKINSVTTTLKVNNHNDWEPQGMVLADGFTAEYSFEPGDAGEMTLTITRTGDVAASGETVLASVPIRAWYPHNALGMNSNWIITNKKCVFPTDIQLVTKAGSIEFTDSTNYLGAFSADKIQIDSEAMCEYGYIGVNKGNEQGTIVVTSWHEHNATAMADVAATCTTDGYEGRTFCEECNSVVDWGTTLPATGHKYLVVDGVAKCAYCGELYTGEINGVYYVDGNAANGWVGDYYYVNGVKTTGIALVDGFYYDFGDDGVSQGKYTGLINEGGKYYYAKLGVLATGWVDVDGEWYYFRTTTKFAATGTYTVSGVAFEFGENGALLHGTWVDYQGGKRYYYGPSFYKPGSAALSVWATIDGELYAFDTKGIAYTGINKIVESNSKNVDVYEFDENGVLIGKVNTPEFTGVVITKNAGILYFENGSVNYAGLVKIGDDYYYVKHYGVVATGTYNVTKTNDLVPAGEYEFGEDGKMLNPPVITEPETPEVKNGIVDGVYYENDEAVYAGLIQIGEDYYYIKHYGKVATGTYYVTKNNDIFPCGNYEFDADGKMINPPIAEPEPEIKNGIVNGKYYENDEAVYAGLIQIGDDFYYVKHYGVIATGVYYVTKTNGLVTAGNYEFDADGKMINPPTNEVKNGIVDGKYYENDEAVYAGLIRIGDDFYYVKHYGVIATGVYYVTKTNGLVKAGNYEFGADGKMVNPPA